MMTPDELRKLLIPNTAITSEDVRRIISAAADAWEADIADKNLYRADRDAEQQIRLRAEKRLEAAEGGLRKYGDHMTYCKGNADAPCTCGYHDVCKPAVKRIEGRQAWRDDAALAGEKALFVAAQRSIDDASTIDDLRKRLEAAEKLLRWCNGPIKDAQYNLARMAEEIAALKEKPGHICGDPNSDCDVSCMDRAALAGEEKP
jgi:hypothetical protein